MAYNPPDEGDKWEDLDKECKCHCANFGADDDGRGWCFGNIKCVGAEKLSKRIFNGDPTNPANFVYDLIQLKWCFSIFECVKGKVQPADQTIIGGQCKGEIFIIETRNSDILDDVNKVDGLTITKQPSRLKSQHNWCLEFMYRGTNVTDPTKGTTYTFDPWIKCGGNGVGQSEQCKGYLQAAKRGSGFGERYGVCTRKVNVGQEDFIDSQNSPEYKKWILSSDAKHDGQPSVGPE